MSTQTCISLQGSTACPQYQRFSVSDGFKRDSPNSPQTVTVTDFDAWFNQYLGNVEAFSNWVKAVSGCNDSNFLATNVRYIKSSMCALLVLAEPPCNSETVPNICSSTLSVFSNQFSTDFGLPDNSSQIDPAKCNQVNSNTNLLRSFKEMVNTQPSSNCIPGTDEEVLQCGFSDLNLAKAYCAEVNPADNCCNSQRIGFTAVTDPLKLLPGENLLQPSATLSSSNLNPTAQASKSPTVSGSAVPISSSNPVQGGVVADNMWTTPVIIGVSFACFVALLAIVLTTVLLTRQKKTQSFGKTIGETPIPYKNNSNDVDASSQSTLNADKNAISVAETMQAIYNYVPNLSDEIYLYIGDPIIVKNSFDDGWALGYNMTTKMEGSFPLACVGPFNEGQRGNGEASWIDRNSSLYLGSNSPTN
ncbi:hypothetical protein HDU92_004989 [Lobulomyces angularis]|nr:hypothetical protein HDU92_004989 [Lobulomyces angularis]